MDMSVVIIGAALVSILANFLKVWEFGGPRLSSYIKNLNPRMTPFRLGVKWSQVLSSHIPIDGDHPHPFESLPLCCTDVPIWLTIRQCSCKCPNQPGIVIVRLYD